MMTDVSARGRKSIQLRAFAFLGTVKSSLYYVTMLVLLKHVGTTDWSRDVLKVSVNSSASWSAHTMSTLPGILSRPGGIF